MTKQIFIVILIALLVISCSSNEKFLKEKKYDLYIKSCKEDNAPEDKKAIKKCYQKVADSYFYQDNKYAQARKYYSPLYANDKKMYKKATIKLANQYFSDNNIKKYLSLSEEVEEQDKAYQKVGTLYFMKKEYRKASEYYLKINAKNKIDKIAFIYSDKKRYNRAEYHYKQINRLYEKYNSLAEGYNSEKIYFKSAYLFSKINKTNESKAAYRNLGYYYLNNNNKKITNVKSPITSIVSDKDFIYFSTLDGNIYRLRAFGSNQVEKFMTLNSKIFQLEFNEKKYTLAARTKKGITLINLDTLKKKNIIGAFSIFRISPNGEYMVFADRTGKISILDFESKELMASIKGNKHIINDMKLTNELIITASTDRLIKTFALTNGGKLYQLRGHYGNILKLALTKDQNYLVSIGEDKKIVLWDLKKERKVRMFTSLTSLKDLIFSKDYTQIITAKSNGIDIWNFEAKREITIDSDNSIYSMLMLDDGYTLIYGDKKGNLVLSIINKEIASEEAFTRADLSKEKLLEIAEKFFKEQKYTEMIKYYELANLPEEGYIKLGDFYYENENYENAIKYYKQVTQKNVGEKIAEAYFKLGEYGKAQEYYFRTENNVGLLKTAKMYGFEGNYYMSLKLYFALINILKEASDERKEEKIKAIYFKIAELFITMKPVEDYKGEVADNQEKLEIEKKLKNWYEERYRLSVGYFKKAGYLDEGILKIANNLCNNNNFELAIEYYNKIDNTPERIECIEKAANYHIEKVKEQYQLLGDDKAKNKSVKDSMLIDLNDAKIYYRLLKDKKMLKKLNLMKKKIKAL